jgi:hypothetical protein
MSIESTSWRKGCKASIRSIICCLSVIYTNH